MAATPPPNKERDHYTAKPPVFDGDKFDYWKDRIESFFLGYDVDLWDMIVDGYTHPVDANGQKDEYEKITNKESAKGIFVSLKMTHEGNTQVKETKAVALIQKYEAFKMEEDETFENMFSRFQTLVAGLKVLDKGYSTADHVKKIIRSLVI